MSIHFFFLIFILTFFFGIIFGCNFIREIGSVGNDWQLARVGCRCRWGWKGRDAGSLIWIWGEIFYFFIYIFVLLDGDSKEHL